jgi:hypothetical protein
MKRNRDNASHEFEDLIQGYSPVELPAELFIADSERFKVPQIDAQDLATIPVVPGTLPSDVTVRSTYDTRPVNAYDAIFNVPLGAVEGSPALAVGSNIITVNVPNGYVVVIRGVKIIVTPLPAVSINDIDYLLTLLINGGAVPNYENIAVGPLMNNFLPAHAIAGQNQTFGINYIVNSALPGGTYSLDAQFHCNLILATGIPAAFEIANPTPSKKAVAFE